MIKDKEYNSKLLYSKLLYSKLLDIETELDKLNFNFTNKYSYCIFCQSIVYNESGGVVHASKCVMIQIRMKIKELK